MKHAIYCITVKHAICNPFHKLINLSECTWLYVGLCHQANGLANVLVDTVSFCLLDQGFGLKCSKAVNSLSRIALTKDIYAVLIVASGQFFLQAQLANSLQINHYGSPQELHCNFKCKSKRYIYHWEVPNSIRRFTIQQLTKVIGGFNKLCHIGSGGFGTEYSSCLEDGTLIAIRRASPSS